MHNPPFLEDRSAEDKTWFWKKSKLAFTTHPGNMKSEKLGGKMEGIGMLSKIAFTVISAMVLGVCTYAISHVSEHEAILREHSAQISNLSENIKDMKQTMKEGFEDMKREIRNKHTN